MKTDELDNIMNKVRDDKINEAKVIEKEIRFIIESLDKLKKEINDNGVTTTTENYGQKFVKTNPALDSYNKLTTTYHKYLSTLFDMVDDSGALESEEQELLEFIHR